MIFGLSAHVGRSQRQVFDGSFLAPDDHGMEEGDEHGDEGDDHGDEGDDHGDEGDEHGDEGDEHGDEGDDHGAFTPARTTDASRLVGEVITRWDRYGLYAVGVYGENDYSLGDAEHWEEHGEFELTDSRSTDFFAWAVEGSARFSIDRRKTGRVAVRYEELRPEVATAQKFQRALANVTIPIRIMRPALWPYLEVSRDLVNDKWRSLVGVRLAY